MNISASKKVKCKGKFAVTVELDEGSFEKEKICVGELCLQTEDTIRNKKIAHSVTVDVQNVLEKLASIEKDMVQVQGTLKAQTDAITKCSTEEAETVQSRILEKLEIIRGFSGRSGFDFNCLVF